MPLLVIGVARDMADDDDDDDESEEETGEAEDRRMWQEAEEDIAEPAEMVDAATYAGFGYELVANYTFGKGGQVLVEVALVFTQMGAAVIYFIFIGHNFETVSGGAVSYPLAVMTTSVPLAVACCLRDLSSLSPLGVAAQIALYIGLALVTLYANGFLGRDPVSRGLPDEAWEEEPVHWTLEPT